MTREQKRANIDAIVEQRESLKDKKKITLPCLYCGKEYTFSENSNEGSGVFNVFCPNGECEDRYSATL